MRKTKIIIFIFNLLMIMMILALMHFADCRTEAYIILIILEVFICLFIVKLKQISLIIFSSITIFILAFINMIIIRENPDISFVGTVTSNTIKFYMKDFDREKYYIVNEDKWDVPRNYANTEYNLSNSTIEILEFINSRNHDKIVYQLHGGSYIRPLANEYRDLAVKYSTNMMNSDVATLDYRTAQKDNYPAALEDAVEGYEFLLSRYKAENIVVVGDSAGGNLTLALCLYLRDHSYEMPKGIIVMSPWADLAEKGESYEYNLHKDIMFGVEEGKQLDGYAIDNRYAGDTSLEEPYLSPVYGNYCNFPSTLIQVGTYEMLESDSITIYNKLKEEGADVYFTRYDGMFHQFQLYGFIPESKEAWSEISKFYEQLYIK